MKTKKPKKSALVNNLYSTYFSHVEVNMMDLSKISAEIERIMDSLPIPSNPKVPPSLKDGMDFVEAEMRKLVAKYRQN